MLELINVSKKTGKFELSDISFQLEEGFMLGVIGNNGAGKTTLLKTIAGQNVKYNGRILYNGRDIHGCYIEFMKECAYISEEIKYARINTIMDNARALSVFYDDFDMELFKNLMQEMRISTEKFIDMLSRGEFIRFQIAFARARHAKLYLMDEVTAGLDPVFRKNFYNMLREMLDEGASIIMTTHILSDLNRNMDYICELENGRIKNYQENAGEYAYE